MKASAYFGAGQAQSDQQGFKVQMHDGMYSNTPPAVMSQDQKGVSVEQSGHAILAAGAVKSLVTVGVYRYGMPCKNMFTY